MAFKKTHLDQMSLQEASDRLQDMLIHHMPFSHTEVFMQLLEVLIDRRAQEQINAWDRRIGEALARAREGR